MKVRHVINERLKEDESLKLYSWMIGDEPAGVMGFSGSV